MAKTKISEFSATPANNTDIDSINIAEGCAPSGINDAIRELMAQLKDFQAGTAGDSFNGPIGTTTAAAGAFTTLTTSSTVTHNGGTANGVAYLNGSKVLTTGSALTFDGTNFVTTGNVRASGLIYAGVSASASGQFRVFNSSNDKFLQIFNDGTVSVLNSTYGSSGVSPLAFQISDSEGMRLTSTGLGIGTSSPSFKLDVVGSGAVYASVQNTSTGSARLRLFNTGDTSDGFALINNSGASGQVNILNYKNSAMAFWTNSTQQLTLDAPGNMGLGVTPSAWGAYKPYQVGWGALASTAASQNTLLSSNVYFDGSTFRYIGTGTASYLQQFEGAFIWKTAASGTAGNAISFTQAMTLDASGNLVIGDTNATSISGYTSFKINNATTGGILDLAQAGTMRGRLVATTGSFTLETSGSIPLVFAPTGTERARIDSSGNFTIGGQTATRLEVNLTENDKVELNAVDSTNTARNLVFSTGDTERARIDSSGNLLVGTTSGSGRATITAGSTQNGLAVIVPTVDYFGAVIHNQATSGTNCFIAFGTEASFSTRGTITYNRGAGLTAYNTTSDYRAKDIIGPVVDSGALIDSVPVYMGKMKGATQERPMFIAHETPDYAHTGEKDAVDADGNPVYQQMDASALIPVMWAEIQSLRARLAAANI